MNLDDLYDLYDALCDWREKYLGGNDPGDHEFGQILDRIDALGRTDRNCTGTEAQ